MRIIVLSARQIQADGRMETKMKTRIITAGIGLLLLGVVLFFFQTVVFNLAIAFVCILAVYELLYCTGYVKHKGLVAIGGILAAVTPFLRTTWMQDYQLPMMMLFVIAIFAVMFTNHEEIGFEKIALVFTVSVLVPFALSCFVYVRDTNRENSLFYIMLILACAWISDAGAYFVGRALGKHKLAPKISPKKTVEGAVGGVVICILFNVGFTYGYVALMQNFGKTVVFHLPVLIVVSLVASLIGIFGDLTASIIKRQRKIKDFGTIMPGHGGVIDRFDSVLFIAPLFYFLLKNIQLVTIL